MTTVIFASNPDHEKLVAEIWYNQELIGQISQESDGLVLEFYKPFKISLDDVMKSINDVMAALQSAKS